MLTGTNLFIQVRAFLVVNMKISIYRAVHQSGNHKVEFNVGHLPNGAYTIRLSGEEGILTKPLIMSL